MDYAIKNALNQHHIEKTDDTFKYNAYELKPKIVYKWFMEMFVDSSDWVMVPNVYGMGLFSEGGIFATKPYKSSYFMKMMILKRRLVQYYGWIVLEIYTNRNRSFFLKNPRLSMMVRIF